MRYGERLTERKLAIADAVNDLASERGASPSQMAFGGWARSGLAREDLDRLDE
jgi:hypothetical protein